MDTPQTTTVTQEEIHAWFTEIRDLKNTVAALRSALEKEKIDKEKCVQEAVVAAAREIMGDFTLIETYSHRWKFAKPETPYGKSFEWLADKNIAFCGDWCEGGRVEGAIQSGWGLAGAI